jgi:hypothetical protein
MIKYVMWSFHVISKEKKHTKPDSRWLYWLAVTKTLVGDLPGDPGDLGFQSHDIASGSQGSQGRKQLDSAGSSAPGTVTKR